MNYMYTICSDKGIVPTDKTNSATFWAMVRKELKEDEVLPCECAI